MRNTHFFRRKYGEEKLKRWKIQKCPLQDGNMARKLKIMENEKHPLDDFENDANH